MSQKGTKGAEEIALINRLYKESYPENYCEIEGGPASELHESSQPTKPTRPTDIKNGVTHLYGRMSLHPSITKKPDALYAGTEVNAEFVAKFLKMKGW
jgi:hypothetical protein